MPETSVLTKQVNVRNDVPVVNSNNRQIRPRVRKNQLKPNAKNRQIRPRSSSPIDPSRKKQEISNPSLIEPFRELSRIHQVRPRMHPEIWVGCPAPCSKLPWLECFSRYSIVKTPFSEEGGLEVFGGGVGVLGALGFFRGFEDGALSQGCWSRQFIHCGEFAGTRFLHFPQG